MNSPTVPALPVIFALSHRELVRFFRQRNRVIGAFLQPVIFWLLFSEGLRSSSLGYAHFYPGTLAMILLFTAIFATISIIEDRNEGFLQGVLVAPVPRWAMVLGKVIGGAAIAMIQAVLFMLLGWATCPDVNPEISQAAMAVLLMLLMALALTSLGFLIAWRMDSSQAYHAIMSVFLFPMWLLSGAFFPQGSEGLLGWVVAINPLTYGVAGLNRYLVHADLITPASSPIPGLPNAPSLAACWIVTALFAAAMLGLCWKVAGTRTKGDFVS